MAWEWVAPVSSAGGAALVLTIGWKFTALGWRHQQELAEKERDHARQMAHDQWYRDRRASAYLALLPVVAEYGKSIQDYEPEYGDENSGVAEYAAMARAEVWGPFEAFALPTVRAAAAAWWSAVEHVQRTIGLPPQPGETPEDAFYSHRRVMQAEIDARAVLVRAIREDLRAVAPEITSADDGPDMILPLGG